MPLSAKQPLLIDLTGSVPGAPTVFPSSPGDGDEIVVIVDSTPTSWRFRYNAFLPAWLFVGGAPMAANITTSESTASTSFVDLTTVGPSLTVPRTGLYTITFHCGYWAGAASNGAIVTPTSPTLGTSAANGIRMISVTGGQTIRHGGSLGPVTLTAAETLKLQYAAQVGGTSTFDQRRIFLIPHSVT